MAGWSILRVLDDPLVAGAHLGAVLPSAGACAGNISFAAGAASLEFDNYVTLLGSGAQSRCTPV